MKKQKSKHNIGEFLGVIPYSTIERVLGKAELKKFNKFMEGQTIMLLHKQGGVHYGDLLRFLSDINDRTLYD
jgi:hypothetical protein